MAREDTLDIDQIAAETDFIVLTQGIDDHAHKCASWPAGDQPARGMPESVGYGTRLRCRAAPLSWLMAVAAAADGAPLNYSSIRLLVTHQSC